MRHVAWLIEYDRSRDNDEYRLENMPVCGWLGVVALEDSPRELKTFRFITDAYEALHFCRQRDAKYLLELLTQYEGLYENWPMKATEHTFQ